MIKIKNIEQDSLDIDVIRYFMNNNIEYLIYSLNEIDNLGYTKLYASKIIGAKACIIEDNEEWNIIKEIIKQIVRCNREGNTLELIDLPEQNLNDIILQDNRVFKLQGNLVNLLSENKKIKNINSGIIELELIEETKDEDYFQLYQKELEKNKQLEEQIVNYKNVINKIKEIVEIVE